MRPGRIVALIGLLGGCGDSSSEMSALHDSGVGGAVASGGVIGSGGSAGQAGGMGGNTISLDAARVVKTDGSYPITVDVASPIDVGRLIDVGKPIDLGRPIEVGRIDSLRINLDAYVAQPDAARVDVAAGEVARTTDAPLIRGFDAELAANLLPSAVTCCRRVYARLDGGSLAACEDLARGDAWRAYQYLLVLQQQGLLCTDLPY